MSWTDDRPDWLPPAIDLDRRDQDTIEFTVSGLIACITWRHDFDSEHEAEAYITKVCDHLRQRVHDTFMGTPPPGTITYLEGPP